MIRVSNQRSSPLLLERVLAGRARQCKLLVYVEVTARERLVQATWDTKRIVSGPQALDSLLQGEIRTCDLSYHLNSVVYRVYMQPQSLL